MQLTLSRLAVILAVSGTIGCNLLTRVDNLSLLEDPSAYSEPDTNAVEEVSVDSSEGRATTDAGESNSTANVTYDNKGASADGNARSGRIRDDASQ